MLLQETLDRLCLDTTWLRVEIGEIAIDDLRMEKLDDGYHLYGQPVSIPKLTIGDVAEVTMRPCPKSREANETVVVIRLKGKDR